MGSKSPHLTNTVGIENPYPLVKASHWGNLRRQDMGSPEMRVGRPTGIDGIISKMVMVMFCLFLGKTAITFFILAEK